MSIVKKKLNMTLEDEEALAKELAQQFIAWMEENGSEVLLPLMTDFLYGEYNEVLRRGRMTFRFTVDADCAEMIKTIKQRKEELRNA